MDNDVNNSDNARDWPTRSSLDPRHVLAFEIADLISKNQGVKEYLFAASKDGSSQLVSKEDFPLGQSVNNMMEKGVKSYVQNPKDPDEIVRGVVASNVLSRFQEDYHSYSTEELQTIKEELVNGGAEFSSLQYKASKILDGVQEKLTDAWCSVAPPVAEKIGLSGLFNQEPEYKIISVPGTRWLLPEPVEPLCPREPSDNGPSASIGRLGS